MLNYIFLNSNSIRSIKHLAYITSRFFFSLSLLFYNVYLIFIPLFSFVVSISVTISMDDKCPDLRLKQDTTYKRTIKGQKIKGLDYVLSERFDICLNFYTYSYFFLFLPTRVVHFSQWVVGCEILSMHFIIILSLHCCCSFKLFSKLSFFPKAKFSISS